MTGIPTFWRTKAGRELWKLTPLLLPVAMMAAGVGHTLRASLTSVTSLVSVTSLASVTSLTSGAGASEAGAFGAGAYEAALAQPGLLRNVVFSLYVAGVSTLISVVLGTGLAYLIRRLPAVYRRRAVGFLVPLILPHIAVGFLVLLWFSQTGILAAGFARLGVGGAFHSPLFRGDGVGIILGYVYKSTPFVLLLIFPILRRIPDGYIQTARMLGAGELRCFRQVVLPRLLPGIFSVSIIIFVYSFGAYDLPFILGESRPRMISLYLYRLYFSRPIAERPVAAALLILLFLAGLGLVLLYARAVRGVEERERRL